MGHCHRKVCCVSRTGFLGAWAEVVAHPKTCRAVALRCRGDRGARIESFPEWRRRIRGRGTLGLLFARWACCYRRKGEWEGARTCAGNRRKAPGAQVATATFD